MTRRCTAAGLENHKRPPNDGGSRRGTGDKSKPDGSGSKPNVPPEGLKPVVVNVETFFTVLNPRFEAVHVDPDGTLRSGVATGRIWPGVLGFPVSAVRGGPGWLVISSDPAKNTTIVAPRPAVELMTIPEYSTLIAGQVRRFVERDYWVFVTPHARLMQTYRHTTTTQTLRDGATTLMASYPYVDTTDTTEYFFDMAAYQLSRNLRIDVQKLLITKGGDVGMIQDPNLPFYSPTPGSSFEDFGDQFTKVYDYITPDLQEYIPRRDFVIRSARGFGLELPTTLPKFSSLPAWTARPKGLRHSTKFFGFVPGTRIYSGSSPVNMDNALGRLFKAGPYEASLRSSACVTSRRFATQLAMDFGDQWMRRQDLMEGGMYGKDGFMKKDYAPDCPVALSPAPLMFTPEAIDGARSSVVGHMEEMRTRCDRSNWDKLFDSIKTTVGRIYYGLAMVGSMLLWDYFTRSVTAYVTHCKKEARVRYFKGERIYEKNRPSVTKVDIKFKEDEVAKCSPVGTPQKPGRTTADFGAAAIYWSEGCFLLKMLLMGSYEYQTAGRAFHKHQILVKTSDTDLNCAFQMLYDLKESGQGVGSANFSDDLVMVAVRNGVVTMGNGDMSRNDSNQPMSSFLVVESCLEALDKTRAEGLTALALLPYSIYSPDKSTGFVAQFLAPTQGSGHALTTAWNNVSCSSVAVATADLFARSEESLSTCFSAGAFVVGHEVTFEEVACFEGLQLLKRSPFVKLDGSVACAQNIACLLKTFGSVRGDLTAKMCNVSDLRFANMDANAKVNRFCSSVVAGWVHEPSYALLDAFRARFPPSVDTVPLAHRYDDDLSDRVFCIPPSCTDNSTELYDTAFQLRYQIPADELEAAIEAVRCCAVGRFFDLPAFRKIMHVDYAFPLYPG